MPVPSRTTVNATLPCPRVDQPNPLLGEHLAGQTLVFPRRGEQIDLFRIVDQGVDDVRLSTRRDLRTYEVVHAGAPIRRAERRLYGRATRRHLVEQAQVEIPMQCHGERTRDRGRRHHQHVGGGALPLEQGHALLHTEAVLFIDYDQAQRRERDRLLNQGMRTHDHPSRAGCDRLSGSKTLRRAE